MWAMLPTGKINWCFSHLLFLSWVVDLFYTYTNRAYFYVDQNWLVWPYA